VARKPRIDPVRWQPPPVDPLPRAPILRKLVWRLPARLQPQIKPEIWAVAFDPDDGAPVAGLRTAHPDFGAVAGMVEAVGKLGMGRSVLRPLHMWT
jgi:hypothetical protein